MPHGLGALECRPWASASGVPSRALWARTRELWGCKAALPRSPWGRGPMPTATPALPAAGPWPEAVSKRPGARPSTQTRTARRAGIPAGARCPCWLPPGPARGSPSPGLPSRSRVAGGPPGARPRHPRCAGRIAPGFSASFQFLPTSGGNQGAEVRVTLRSCREFHETKKETDNPPSSSSPVGRGAPRPPVRASEGRWARSGLRPRAPTGTTPDTVLSDAWPGDSRSNLPTVPRPRGPRRAAPTSPTEDARPGSAPHAPVALALLAPGLTSCHPAQRGERSGPSSGHRPRPEFRRCGPLTCGALGPGVPPPLALPPPPPTLLASSSARRRNPQPSQAPALIPGGGVQVPRATPPSAGQGHPGRGEETGRSCSGWEGREEFAPRKRGTHLTAGRSASPSLRPWTAPVEGSSQPEDSSLDQGRGFWGALELWLPELLEVARTGWCPQPRVASVP